VSSVFTVVLGGSLLQGEPIARLPFPRRNGYDDADERKDCHHGRCEKQKHSRVYWHLDELLS
jgi:hypothetical protein